MREFFKPWRRRVGLLVLTVSCAMTALWVRSFRMHDQIVLRRDEVGNGLVIVSWSGGAYLSRVQLPLSPLPFLITHELPLDDPIRHQHDVPYLPIMVALTLLSAGLLLVPARNRNRPPDVT